MPCSFLFGHQRPRRWRSHVSLRCKRTSKSDMRSYRVHLGQPPLPSCAPCPAIDVHSCLQTALSFRWVIYGLALVQLRSDTQTSEYPVYCPVRAGTLRRSPCQAGNHHGTGRVRCLCTAARTSCAPSKRASALHSQIARRTAPRPFHAYAPVSELLSFTSTPARAARSIASHLSGPQHTSGAASWTA